ncbi:HTH-type transcriptional repressor AseR [Maioricimonas rarisocia]|uniref:HTH-type transcriptional repressor AseR n=1 Tax=Maioricimonas rarisocia TaxID=2528026 RepID=A0A517Z6B9_9PLAN|nr:metalloregulator ArsR/SmtB family transcription factor [Maioricimonas rarisocia]QDU38023.1 HTH-type transcriptional repressor AseR [Maioricimonas rarisocia]
MDASLRQLDLVTVFRACADRTRLRILNLLRGGELCVCDLVDVLDVPQPTASRHLAYLRKAGLVVARKEGLWHYYRLVSSESEFHRKLLECLQACADVDAELNGDQERLRLGCRPDCCD